MTRRFNVTTRCALLAGTTALLAACASAPTRFFTLDPVAPAQAVAGAYSGPPVKLVAVNIPPQLDREELVSETAPGEVKVHDLEHWEAPLGLTARQTLIEDLAARLPAGRVLGPATPAGAEAAILSVDVVSFNVGPQGAQMQVAWTLTLPAAAEDPAPAVFRAPLMQLQAPVSGAHGGATAAAFSALLGQVSDQIASALPAQIQAQAEAQAMARAQRAMHATRTRTTTMTHTTPRQP